VSETPAEAVASAQGVDVSSYQMPLDPGVLKGMSFAWAKATNGLSGTDPNFPPNWGAIKAAKVHRGAYHELTPDNPASQALAFMGAVRGQGLVDGDMLACVASDYTVTGAQARGFLDAVRSMAGPRHPVLLYSDLSRLDALGQCAGYPLWVAAYAGSAPASVAPWGSWAFWQWQAGGGADGGDRDAFNGTAAAFDAWNDYYLPSPAPQSPPGAPGLSVTGLQDGADLGWSLVDTAPQRAAGREYELEVIPDWGTRTIVGQHAHADLKPGHYQARIRVAGDPHAPFSDWHSFTVTG
jgi:lysozyme